MKHWFTTSKLVLRVAQCSIFLCILLMIMIYATKPFPYLEKHLSGFYKTPQILLPTSAHSDDQCFSNKDFQYVEENFEQISQDDARLIAYSRNRYITPISKKPYQFKNKDTKLARETDYGRWVRTLFKNKRDGIFIEAGANGGEYSHTRYLESALGWTGILIECSPSAVPHLKTVNRKAWIASVCLSLSQFPTKVNLSVPDNWSYSSRLGQPWELRKDGDLLNWTSYDNMEAIPLFPIMASVGITNVDYFSFDIEGSELQVLRNIPFDRVTFKVLIIEVFFYKPKEREELRNLLTNQRMHFVKEIEKGMDEIYVHESLLQPYTNMTLESIAEMKF